MESGAERPLLAISMGDPAGIGPEVIAKAMTVRDVRDVAWPVVYGDCAVLAEAAKLSSLTLEIRELASPRDAVGMGDPSVIPVVPVSSLEIDRHEWGVSTEGHGRHQLDYIERAAADVLSNQVDALVTAPITKVSIASAGSKFTGHTDMLAELWCPEATDRPRPVMMLAGERLKVVPLTVHMSLSAVVDQLDRSLVLHGIRVCDDAFRRHFGLSRPRIAVAGLNPHAGEDGMFGLEEIETIGPAIEEARAEGIMATGPYPPDTIFKRAVDGEYDVVIGMYHDQALIPVKLLDFDRAVNVTLGLPRIRTSVDHGTAYDLAGRGVASAGSMIAALKLAERMARSR